MSIIWPFIFWALLFAALCTDIKSRRIPNSLILVSLGLGLGYVIIAQGLQGLLPSLEGFALGLLLWLPWYLVFGLGAGDVKLMAAIGLWVGPGPLLTITLATALWGGIIALIQLIYTKGLSMTATSLTLGLSSPSSLKSAVPQGKRPLPYAVAIILGVLTALLYLHSNLLPIPL